MTSSQQLLDQLPGITYRQLDYWARMGHLDIEGEPVQLDTGSGYSRVWTPAQVELVKRVADGVTSGLTLASAVTYAHKIPRTDDGRIALYIAGPMTGITDHNFPAFNVAEERLAASGYRALNPARHGQGEGTWSDYMRRDIADVLTVDGLAVLPGWQRSRGASLEVHIADQLDIRVRPVSAWVAEVTP